MLVEVLSRDEEDHQEQLFDSEWPAGSWLLRDYVKPSATSGPRKQVPTLASFNSVPPAHLYSNGVSEHLFNLNPEP